MSKSKDGTDKQRAKDMWKGYRLGVVLGLAVALEKAVKAADLDELIDFLNEEVIRKGRGEQ